MAKKRDYKEFGIGEWYHTFNRGNGRMGVFNNAQDHRAFLDRLASALGHGQGGQGAPLTMTTSGAGRVRVRVTPFESGAFSIAAYCLMPNHFHILVQQNTDVPVSKLLLKVLTSYSMYFNRKYDHVGHVFQDRFKAVHIADNTQLLHVSAYIHQNPKVGKLVRQLHKWEYSSYPEYLGKTNRELCDKNVILGQFRNAREYEQYVENTFEDIRARKDVRELMIDE